MNINDVFFKFSKTAVLAGVVAFSPAALAQQHHDGGGRPEGGRAGAAVPRAVPHQEPAHRPEPARPVEPVRRPEAERHAVERVEHGSIRHADAPVIRNERVVVHNEVHNYPRHVDRDYDHGSHFWGGFVAGAIVASLPIGYQTVEVNNTPYYYYDGMYYQQAPTGYQEVYAPLGAVVAQLPPGAIPIVVGYATYYYAGGTFYIQQGSVFTVIQPPSGIPVPELPPGAAQVALNGQIAFLFNGIYYVPVFVNGVTQYQTFVPQQ